MNDIKKNNFIYCSFKELEGCEEYPSIFGYLRHQYTAKEKAKIVDYLKKGKVELAAPSILEDVFTGKKIGVPDQMMTDGEVHWPYVLAYYVEKYDIGLPIELEKRIT